MNSSKDKHGVKNKLIFAQKERKQSIKQISALLRWSQDQKTSKNPGKLKWLFSWANIECTDQHQSGNNRPQWRDLSSNWKRIYLSNKQLNHYQLARATSSFHGNFSTSQLERSDKQRGDKQRGESAESFWNHHQALDDLSLQLLSFGGRAEAEDPKPFKQGWAAELFWPDARLRGKRRCCMKDYETFRKQTSFAWITPRLLLLVFGSTKISMLRRKLLPGWLIDSWLVSCKLGIQMNQTSTTDENSSFFSSDVLWSLEFHHRTANGKAVREPNFQPLSEQDLACSRCGWLLRPLPKLVVGNREHPP